MLLRLQNSFAGMDALARQHERVANNLANANTIGYRRDRVFVEALNEELDAEQAPRSDRRTTQWAESAQGALDKTDNPLDVAIKGDGFFVLTNENTGQTTYSRAGHFQLDEDGALRTPEGLAVEGEGGPVEITGGPVEILSNGAVQVGGETVDTLRVVTFDDPTQLQRQGGSQFTAPGMEPLDAENPEVLQGFLESSNVNPIQEMTDMIAHMRLFESHQKFIQSQDQSLERVTRELGRF